MICPYLFLLGMIDVATRHFTAGARRGNTLKSCRQFRAGMSDMPPACVPPDATNREDELVGGSNSKDGNGGKYELQLNHAPNFFGETS
jgi:hypothetical protein